MEFQGDRPRWKQVFEIIESRILDGTYPPGSRVPSVVQLTGEFGIANATAHKALRALREKGFTKTEPGMGSFVVGTPSNNGADGA